jgi:hypothetical protein
LHPPVLIFTRAIFPGWKYSLLVTSLKIWYVQAEIKIDRGFCGQLFFNQYGRYISFVA